MSGVEIRADDFEVFERTSNHDASFLKNQGISLHERTWQRLGRPLWVKIALDRDNLLLRIAPSSCDERNTWPLVARGHRWMLAQRRLLREMGLLGYSGVLEVVEWQGEMLVLRWQPAGEGR